MVSGPHGLPSTTVSEWVRSPSLQDQTTTTWSTNDFFRFAIGQMTRLLGNSAISVQKRHNLYNMLRGIVMWWYKKEIMHELAKSYTHLEQGHTMNHIFIYLMNQSLQWNVPLVFLLLKWKRLRADIFVRTYLIEWSFLKCSLLKHLITNRMSCS